MMPHLLFLQHSLWTEISVSSISVPLFSMPESSELCVSQQFNILKSYKIEEEEHQIHFFYLLESQQTARLPCPFIFQVDFGEFIIQFIRVSLCWSYLI